MAYVVDRVVICDAFQEPERHYQLLAGGRSKLAGGRRKMPETANLLRYALKLATGTGKTVVMALFVTWATLHKRKVSGSSLSANFLVLVPNLTVRDRVSGVPRGEGLGPTGEHNLYDAVDVVPPEYREEFRPNVLVRNWQGIPLEGTNPDYQPIVLSRDDAEHVVILAEFVTVLRGLE